MEQIQKDYTVDDIQKLLANNGARKDKQAFIRIYDYNEIIPDNTFLDQQRQLGKGGYGQVYVINLNGFEYALKIMTQTKGKTQQQLINDFYNELNSLLSVNHANVLKLVGVSIETSKAGQYCFCHLTDYFKKGSLQNVIKQRGLFPDKPKGSQSRFYQKLILLSQIAEGIHAIHNRGLIHRDIKSDNILLDEAFAPKIADLGLTSDADISKTLFAKGTVQWMSPELFDLKISFACDIWALACVAVEIFNEDLPYPGIDQSKIKDLVYKNRKFPIFSQEIQQDLDLVALLQRSFSYESSQRPNIIQFKQELQKIINKIYPQIQVQFRNNPESTNSSAQNNTKNQNPSNFSSLQNLTQTQGNVIGNVSLNFQYVSFLKDANTIIIRNGINFEEKSLQNSKILMDEESSIYYTQDFIFVSGGRIDGQCSRNFQVIQRKSFQVIKQCEMLSPRNGHGMVHVIEKDNLLVYILSGNIQPWEDQEKCEVFDFNEGKCKEFSNLVVKGKNFGVVLDNQNIFVLGGICCGYFSMVLGQQYDPELQMWKIFPQCMPNASSVTLARDEDGSIYMFGEYLLGTYKFNWKQEPYFELITENKYPGEPCNQNAIILDNQIYIYDRNCVYCFNIQNKTWNKEYEKKQVIQNYTNEQLIKMLEDLKIGKNQFQTVES